MQTSPLIRHVIGFSVAATLLASCGSAQPLIASPSSTLKARATRTETVRNGSWALPEAKSDDLLYVANVAADSKGAGTIAIYSYPQGKLVGDLKGFSAPYGLCVDKIGNVFVANFGGETIVEYAHGGSKPIETLHDNGAPNGCAIDPVTGDLAATNSCDGPIGDCYPSGTVLIYAHAKGAPRVLTDKYATQMFFCNYDSAGNLFVDGVEYAYHLTFAELPRGGAAFAEIILKVPKHPQFAGGLQQVGKRLVVGAADGNTVYEYAVGHYRATRDGTTQLNGLSSCCGTNQFLINDNTLIAPADSTTQHPRGAVEYFSYPKGGNPTRIITNGANSPWAVVISRGKG
jgi:hypothetical protein